MDNKLFVETFSKLEASEQAKKELLNRMDNQEDNGKRKPVKVLRIVAVAAAAVALLTTAVFAAGGGLFRQWQAVPGDEDTLYRGDFEVAIKEPDKTPEDSSDDMVTLPYHSVGTKVVVDSENRVKLYVFAASGVSTVIDEIVDITDDLAASEDGTCRYQKVAEGPTGTFTVDLTVKPGWPEYASEEPIYGEQGYGYIIDGSFDFDNGMKSGYGSYQVGGQWKYASAQWYSGKSFPEPVRVPLDWDRGSVTGYGNGEEYEYTVR